MITIRIQLSYHRELEELREYKEVLVTKEILVDKDFKDLLVPPDQLLVISLSCYSLDHVMLC